MLTGPIAFDGHWSAAELGLVAFVLTIIISLYFAMGEESYK